MDTATTLRIPDHFKEFDGDVIMSNFDHEIYERTARAIIRNAFFSRYCGWGFNGKVWWDEQSWKWCCEVWTYGSYCQTYTADTLEEIMSEVSSDYGYE